jgi:hypothetical protein
MKLNKQQVEAIASKIKKNVIDPISQYNNDIRNSVEYTDFENLNEKCIKLKELLSNLGVDYQINQIICKIKNDYFKDKLISPPNFGYDNCDIINDIILGTIEYDNLDELINSLSEKYANA